MFTTGPKKNIFDIRDFIYKLWCNTYIGVDEVITAVSLTSENITDMKHQRILSALSQLTDAPNATPIFLEDYARIENPESTRRSYNEAVVELGIDKSQKCRFIADAQYVPIVCLRKILAEHVGKILNQTLDEKTLMETIDIMCAKTFSVKKAALEFYGQEGESIPPHVLQLMSQRRHKNKTYVIRRTFEEYEELPVIVKEKNENGKIHIKILIEVLGKYKSGATNMEVKSAVEKVIATESMSKEELEAERFFGPPGSCRITASDEKSYSIPSVYEPSVMTKTDRQTVFPGRSMLTRLEYEAIGSDTMDIEEDEDEVISPDFGIDNWIIERHWKEMKVPSEDRIEPVIPAIGKALLLKLGFMKDVPSSVYPVVILQQEAKKIEKYISGARKRKSGKMSHSADDDSLSMAAKRRKLEEDSNDLIRKFLPHFGATPSTTFSPPTSSLNRRITTRHLLLQRHRRTMAQISEKMLTWTTMSKSSSVI